MNQALFFVLLVSLSFHVLLASKHKEAADSGDGDAAAAAAQDPSVIRFCTNFNGKYYCSPDARSCCITGKNYDGQSYYLCSARGASGARCFVGQMPNADRSNNDLCTCQAGLRCIAKNGGDLCGTCQR